MSALLVETPSPTAQRCPRCRHAVRALVEGSDVCIDCDSLIDGEPTMTDTVPTAVKAKILRFLAGTAHPRLELPSVADLHNLTLDQVKTIVEKHGYPRQESMLRAAKLLEQQGEKPETPASPSTVTPFGSRHADPPKTPRPAASSSDTVHALINTAKGTGMKRIENLANRILDEVTKLRGLVDEHEAKAEQERAAAEEREKARAEVARLEQQLAEAKSRLRPVTTKSSSSPTATPGDGPSAKEIRAWAAEHDVACPGVGRVPGSVREAYDAAHAKAAS